MSPRYIFNSQVKDSLTYSEALLDLLRSCWTYLCYSDFDASFDEFDSSFEEYDPSFEEFDPSFDNFDRRTDQEGVGGTDHLSGDIILGKFRLLSFATSNWVLLVQSYLRVSSRSSDLDKLCSLISQFIKERKNDGFVTSDEEPLDGGLKVLGGEKRSLAQFLSRAISFQKRQQENEWTIDNGIQNHPFPSQLFPADAIISPSCFLGEL